MSGRPVFAPPPAAGRVFTAPRMARRGDVTPGGRLRFDALGRYLQDVAEDDIADAGWQEPYDWLLRRCVIAVRDFPRRGERFQLATFCSATGPRWAERTTTLTGSGGDLIQATAVWVAIERATGQPCPLGPVFHRLYSPSAGGRRVSARLSHPPPGPSAPGLDWPLRASDFDPGGHVGNPVHWQAAEEVLAGLDWLPARAEIEYHRPVLPGHHPRLVTELIPAAVSIWLLNGPQVLASARLIP